MARTMYASLSHCIKDRCMSIIRMPNDATKQLRNTYFFRFLQDAFAAGVLKKRWAWKGST